MSELQEKEKLYLLAKEKYYNEEPIMNDSAFDELEEWLKSNNSSLVLNIGSWDRKAKFPHPSKMGSLEKIQADKTTGEAPWELFSTKWYNNIIESLQVNSIDLEWTQKLDGNAVNLIYINGKLTQALSRGDGTLGRDYLPRIDVSQLPITIPLTKNIVEVRCEAVVRKDIFDEKYLRKPELSEEENKKRFSNERNYVAGVLNNDDATKEQVSEIHLIPVEMHEVLEKQKIIYHNINAIENWGFKYYNFLIIKNVTQKITEPTFKELFNNYEYFRHNESPYRLDGIVVKIKASDREIIGETEHHPKWAIAIKFKPENAVTSVKGFKIKMGKTGNFTPVVVLDPIDLDGSIVSQASGYNYKYIIDNKIGVGAMVTLIKSGDIIPQIISVDVPATNTFELPNICPHCGASLVIINETHLSCPNEECEGKKLFKFINSMNVLDLDGVGDALLEDLFNNVQQPASYYLGNRNEEDFLPKLIESGMKDGKIIENFVKELRKINKLTIEQLIGFMSLEGMSIGGKTIKEIAKKLSNVDYSFTGLEKKVVSGWDYGEYNYENFRALLNFLNSKGIEIEWVKKRDGNVIKLCLTGSPKPFNFKSKGDFIKHLVELGYVVDQVTVGDCEYLVTDDLESKSSKMTKALKDKKQIILYDYFELKK